MPTKTSEKDDPTNFLVMIANNKKIAFFLVMFHQCLPLSSHFEYTVDVQLPSDCM